MDTATRLEQILRHLKPSYQQTEAVRGLRAEGAKGATDGALAGKTAVVTGGSRGIGNGVALALAKEGARVYVTGKSVKQEKLDAMKADVTGVMIAVACDHQDDGATTAVFDRVFSEAGSVDILVNNATQGAAKVGDGKFWEQDPSFYDAWMNVGLRSHYVCSALVIRKMLALKQGQGRRCVIVNISSFGAITPYNSVAYCMGKTAIDRFVADSAIELKDTPISIVSLYPGLVKTENVLKVMGERVGKSKNAETPEFVGRAVVALAADKTVKRLSGKVLIAQELADEYGFTEVEGHVPNDKVMRGLRKKFMSKPPPHWQLN